jgi:hypothetical protein
MHITYQFCVRGEVSSRTQKISTWYKSTFRRFRDPSMLDSWKLERFSFYLPFPDVPVPGTRNCEILNCKRDERGWEEVRYVCLRAEGWSWQQEGGYGLVVHVRVTEWYVLDRTFPDYNDYISTWVEYKNFYDELSLSTTIRGTQTQLKNGDIVLMKLE